MALVANRPFMEPMKESLGRPSKRLKLMAKKSYGPLSSILGFINQLDASTNSNKTLEILAEIQDGSQYDESEFPEAIRRLCELFRKDKESTVRIKVLSLLVDLVHDNNYDGNALIDDIMSLLKQETSAKVISQGLTVLMRLGKTLGTSCSQIPKMILFAKQKLLSPSHNVQRHALVLLGSFLPPDAEQENLNLVGKYTDSQDARVRAQAFSSMLALGQRGIDLTPNLYQRAVEALKDDYECVRKEALQLIFEIGVRHPEHLIKIEDSDQEIRLIDDAFGKVCIMLCDLSMHVRTQAAELLGGMSKVSEEFLHQTLDKKLMSNMRRKKSLHERSLEHFTSGEWSTGKKWADDAPKEMLAADSISLMASGACGALVQGLEDEFLEVRTASVDSMCQLALTNPTFAVTSLDFLVDMFNDEIEAVRLKAIFSLTAISKHIILREDQVEIILSSLEDYSVEVREGLHIMLGACKVSTQNCLTLVVQKVLDVLSKYPQDKLSAYGCLQRVGQKHPELCMSLTPQLLQDHPFFDSPERDVEDPSYICILIMLFNAAQHLPPMLSLFPDTTVKHYAYLRDTMPNFVPRLPIGGSPIEMNLTGATGSRQFLETLLVNIQSSYSAPKARQALLQAAQENLARLAAIDPSLSGTANFTAEFLGAQLLTEQLQSCVQSQTQTRAPSKECLNQLVRRCLKLQNLFSNLTLDDQLLVKQISLRASALQLVLIVKDKNQSALAPCQLLLHIASDASVFLEDNPYLTPDSFTKAILSQLAVLTDPKPGRVFREILPIVQVAAPVATPLININIKMCTARILEPVEANSTENVFKVTAGLIAALPLVVEIENLQENQVQNLRIKIKYPDQNTYMAVPRLRDLKKVILENGKPSDDKLKLRTQVLLSHGVWTEASQVEISLCLSVRRPGNELELCKPVKVTLFPKPVKRGI
ncbi:integrator complex subunit 4 isoform X2 [Culicoides brevitarsis]|uniref:integrator complex subunit 4 isoform X2 n=1 Tax=Culicoides brevitarsis TaxID=469753 RepID=UPI00307C7CCF